jgi:hypothetical protein
MTTVYFHARHGLSVLLVVLFTSAIVADAPTVSYIFPAGGQRGTTVTFNVGGHYLHEQCPFQMIGPGVQASLTIKRADHTTWFEGPRIPMPASQAGENYPKDQVGEVVIGKNAPLGFRRWRVWTSQGATTTRKFVIGDLPEIVEEEIDGTPVPTRVVLPVTINGRVFPREDVDCWTFEAQQGKGYTCEVMAARLGSPLDSHLELRGPDGQRLAENTDAIGLDSRISFVAPETGVYELRIHDVKFGGLQDYVYRLTITDGAYVEGVFPLGWNRGEKLELELVGQNLGAGKATVTVPAAAGPTWLTRLEVDGRLTNTIQLEISDVTEYREVDKGDPTTRALPAVFNGRIDSPGDQDTWWFQAAADQKIELEVRAARLGSPLDSVLMVLDAEGKELARSDDLAGGQPDSKLIFTVPADGTYQAQLYERFAFRGGPAYAYRLVVGPVVEAAKDFQLVLTADTLSVNRGTEGKFKVTVKRQGGFDEEIQLAVEGLPEGIELSGDKIPKGKNETSLGFKVPEDAPIQVVPVKIVGTAIAEDASFKRVATQPAPTADDLLIDELTLAVAMPTPYKIVGVFQTQYSPRGGTFFRTYSIERTGYDGPITVSLGDRQVRHLQGVTGPTIVVPAGATEFTYPIKLAPWMEVGRTSRTVVMGVSLQDDGQGGKQKVSYTSNEQNDQIIILVDPGQLQVQVKPETVFYQPGKTLDVEFTVDRGRGLEGDVLVELVPPEHIKDMVAGPVKLAAGERKGVLRIRCAESLGSHLNMPLTVRVTAMPGGNPYTAETTLSVLPPAR